VNTNERHKCADCNADVFFVADAMGMNIMHADPVCEKFKQTMKAHNAKDLGVVDYSYIPDLPEPLRSIEPVVCRACAKRVWYSRQHRLVFHEEPRCEMFKALMAELDAVDLGEPVGEG
jgi:hypothetical protein